MKQRRPSGAMKARLAGAVRKGRRETLYKILAKRHQGLVPCYVCCGHVEPEDATLEHILEQRNGGTDEMSNLAISHEICNQERGKFTMNLYSLCEPHLNAAGIDIKADFHTLPASKVSVLCELAHVTSYKQPSNANGSIGRTFFEKLQRQYRREA